MDDQHKTILVVARHNKPEALRMASGLTLSDDEVTVDVIGGLGDDAVTALQLEALEFSEVPVITLNPALEVDIGRLADDIIRADAVYVL